MAKVVKREELASYVTNEKLDARTRDLLSALEVVRQDLKSEIGLVRQDLKSELTAEIHSVKSELSIELAQHTRAILEAMRTEIRGIDDKYADLPGRVAKLEARRRR